MFYLAFDIHGRDPFLGEREYIGAAFRHSRMKTSKVVSFSQPSSFPNQCAIHPLSWNLQCIRRKCR